VALGTTPKQLTFEGNNRFAVWSPGGTRVAFSAVRDGTDGADIFVKSVTDDTPPVRILSLPGNQDVEHWPAEDVLLFSSRNNGPNDLWMMDPADSASARPYLESEADLIEIAVSTDGSLAAYTSDESGSDQVYVRSFPDPQQPVRVSLDEGAVARWSPTGDTIYYWKSGPVDTLFAARLQRDPTVSVLSREPLFWANYSHAGSDLHPDGDRWVIPQRVRAATPQGTEDAPVEPERFFIVTNWFTELRAALGEGN
jgi:Tol biopolymer transport system component